MLGPNEAATRLRELAALLDAGEIHHELELADQLQELVDNLREKPHGKPPRTRKRNDN